MPVTPVIQMPERGRILGAAEAAEYDALAAAVRPDAALKRLDDYAKWIFTSATTVGVLAAAFSTEAFKTLTPIGQGMLAVAVLCLGVSLVFAARSAAPKWQTYDPFSPDSLRDAIQATYDDRKSNLTIAGAAFGLALLVAAAIPAVTVVLSPPTAQTRIGYQLGSDGSIAASASVDSLGNGDVVLVEVSNGASVVASGQGTADATGKVALQTAVKEAAPGAYTITVRRRVSGGDQALGAAVTVNVPARPSASPGSS